MSGDLEYDALRAASRDRRRRDTSDPTRSCRAAGRARRPSNRRRKRPAGCRRRRPASASSRLRRSPGPSQTSLFVVQASRSLPSRFDTKASSLPSGEKAIALSSAWPGGESKSPGVTSTTRFDCQVRDQHVMADVLAPFIPVPRQQTREAARLDRILLHLVLAPLVAGFVGAFRVDVGHERDREAVGREDERRLHALGELGDPADAAAVGIRDKDLRMRRREWR